jgi:hypothetical protein
VHDPEICSLNGVVGVKGVGNPVPELFPLHLLYDDTGFLQHDLPGPEEAELLHCVLDLGRHSPGCWQHWLRC